MQNVEVSPEIKGLLKQLLPHLDQGIPGYNTAFEIAFPNKNVATTCKRCGKILRDPESVRKGFGRVCFLKTIAEKQVGFDFNE